MSGSPTAEENQQQADGGEGVVGSPAQAWNGRQTLEIGNGNDRTVKQGTGKKRDWKSADRGCKAEDLKRKERILASLWPQSLGTPS